jgi:TRAP-type uncharacterized transport system substrate-binding protein
MKFLLLYRRRWGYLYLPVLLVALLAVLWSAIVWRPLPPTRFSVAGSVTQGGYTVLAQRYRDVMDRRGIEVEVIKSDDISKTIALLADNNNDVDMGFLLGLLSPNTPSNLRALAVIERNPVWIFSRLPEINQTSQFKGLRVTAASTTVRNTQTIYQLLAHANIKTEDVTLAFKNAVDASRDLIDAKTDVVVLLAGSRSDSARALTRAAGIHLVGIDRVLALAARYPLMSPFVLPQGAIELRGDIPPKDLAMVSYGLHVVVNDKMHPALQRQIMDAAQEIHEVPTFLQHQSEFPTTANSDFMLSAVAKSNALGERPWMEQILPYYWAQVAELLLYAVLPILALAVILLLWIPDFFDWKVTAVLQNFYGELKFLETEIEPIVSGKPMEIKRLLQRLDSIEAQVVALDLPEQFADRWYTLRSHLAQARAKLLSLRAR